MDAPSGSSTASATAAVDGQAGSVAAPLDAPTAPIEWGEETVLAPSPLPLAAFCAARGIDVSNVAPAVEPAVFIDAVTWRNVVDHLGSDLRREQGGVLVGLPCRDPATGALFVDVRHAIPATRAIGTPGHLRFTAEAWDDIADRLTRDFPDQVVVGWYHSHPGLGVFLSGTDRASQAAFYRQPWSLALVVDPATGGAGWFAGPTGTPIPGAWLYHVQPESIMADVGNEVADLVAEPPPTGVALWLSPGSSDGKSSQHSGGRTGAGEDARAPRGSTQDVPQSAAGS